jgi:hypothetical protein
MTIDSMPGQIGEADVYRYSGINQISGVLNEIRAAQAILDEIQECH